MRILRDGRVRFSARAFPGLPWLSFLKSDHVSTEIWGRAVLHLRMKQGRVVGASFVPDLTPTELGDAVYALEAAGRGLERWITPALRETQARLSGKDWGQDLLKAIPGIMDSVRHLAVAEGRRTTHPQGSTTYKVKLKQ
jgi:hypothetical protein